METVDWEMLHFFAMSRVVTFFFFCIGSPLETEDRSLSPYKGLGHGVFEEAKDFYDRVLMPARCSITQRQVPPGFSDLQAAAAEEARRVGLGLNAGHDLSLENLHYYHQQIPWTDEVSIGHALICDALYLGLKETIKQYLQALK